MNTTICFTGKDWIGESCPRKGAAQAERHSVRLLSPTLARVICFCVGHDWLHCTCQRCDKVRDEAHDWVLLEGETCKAKCCLCGLPKGLHDYADGVCRHCGDELAQQRKPAPRDAHDPYDTDLTARLPALAAWDPPAPNRFYSHNPNDPYATSWTAHG